MSKVLLIIDGNHFIRAKSMANRNLVFLTMAVFGLRIPVLIAEDTLPPLKDGVAPQSVKALWADFDPRAEPLNNGEQQMFVGLFNIRTDPKGQCPNARRITAQ